VSQYPPPYTPPNVNLSPASPFSQQGRNVAARAAILQMILGGLILLSGTCTGAQIYGRGMDNLITEIQKTMTLPQMSDQDLHAMLRVYMIFSVVASVTMGSLLTLLAGFVRRGGKIGVVISMICVGLVGIVVGFATIGTAMQVGVDVRLIICLAALALCAANFISLLQTLRHGPQSMAVAQQQMWQWVMQQSGSQDWAEGYRNSAPPRPNIQPPMPPLNTPPTVPPPPLPTLPPSGGDDSERPGSP
jgi:hypothetical protein